VKCIARAGGIRVTKKRVTQGSAQSWTKKVLRRVLKKESVRTLEGKGGLVVKCCRQAAERTRNLEEGSKSSYRSEVGGHNKHKFGTTVKRSGAIGDDKGSGVMSPGPRKKFAIGQRSEAGRKETRGDQLNKRLSVT